MPGPTRRRSSQNASFNFRPSGPEVRRADAKGTRPTASPPTVKEIMMEMVLHVCKKSLFYDTNRKVAIYLVLLIVVSAIGDTLPIPRSYLSRSDNVFNRYFVKVGWGWTLLFVIPYTALTSYVICCGNFRKVLTRHLPRIVFATAMWFFWTKFFHYIESTYGRCSTKQYVTKPSCLKAGYLWRGFDISGHAFILIHSSLVLIEEARSIVKWETIKEHLRNELFERRQPASQRSSTADTNPLRLLAESELQKLNFLYKKFTPAINLLVMGMSALQLLWDIMLICTMLYFHRLDEKFLSGVLAVMIWYFAYRFVFPSGILLDPPGTGNFTYQPKGTTGSTCNTNNNRRHGSGTNSNNDSNVPMFMGMPIYRNGANSRNGNGSS